MFNYTDFTNKFKILSVVIESEINKKYLFKLIEEGISSPDDRLANATATRLIEAIINNSTSNPEQWKKFEEGLLKKSKEYALAFRSQ